MDKNRNMIQYIHHVAAFLQIEVENGSDLTAKAERESARPSHSVAHKTSAILFQSLQRRQPVPTIQPFGQGCHIHGAITEE